jgi:glycine hydroxymethyltransferase
MAADRHITEADRRVDSKFYELIDIHGKEVQKSNTYHSNLIEILKQHDPTVYDLIEKEYDRLRTTIQLIAAENQASRAVLAALGSIVQNKTTEGFPGARFHGGCEVVDDIETIACERAKQSFGAKYANVQPHSGTAANQIVMTAVLDKSDKVLSLALDQGGHVSHGAGVSFSGKFFETHHYYLDRESLTLDYSAVADKALKVRPKLIICGATAYPRKIDFEKFRRIADEVGAYLMADVSHIAGLIIAGAHPSPIDCAHFTTTSTYKPGGPRGGLILMGKDFNSAIKVGGKIRPLWKHIDKTTFPGVQGTPYLNNIAAKAVFFNETITEQYRRRQFGIVENAKRLAERLIGYGFDVLTSGTDNHMVLINVSHFRESLTGLIAQKALEDCGIIVNMNRLPYDDKSASVTSGMRLGTPIVTKQGMRGEQMDYIAELIDLILTELKIEDDGQYRLDDNFRNKIRSDVADFCGRFWKC